MRKQKTTTPAADRSSKMTFRACLKELMAFVRPYRLKLGFALFMVIIANMTYAINPMMEGRITTQLASGCGRYSEPCYRSPCTV